MKGMHSFVSFLCDKMSDEMRPVIKTRLNKDMLEKILEKYKRKFTVFTGASSPVKKNTYNPV